VDGNDRRNLILMTSSQFLASVSFHFILVFLPFYVGRISPFSQGETLFWVGAIMGSTGLCLAVTSPVWGYLTQQFSPKSLYIRGLVAHSVMFFLMGFTTHLPTLLVLRVLQGLFGGISTIALVFVSFSSPPARISRDMGFLQNALTLGQLVGPPLGTLAVSALGYRGAFVTASAVLFGSAILCYLYITDVPRPPKADSWSLWPSFNRRIVIAWFLCFVVQIHLMFLPAILPNVFESLAVGETKALNWAGILVMLYTMSALAGTAFWCALAKKTGLFRMIVILGFCAALFQLLLALNTGVIGFTAIRMIQTGLVAAIVPLTLSIFAGEVKGSVIGFLNSARFVGGALGPVMATSILAFSNLPVLYAIISGLSLLIMLPFVFVFKPSEKISGRSVR
jgi:MFS family permease